MDNREPAWKSPALAKQYLEGVRGAIPMAEEQIELLLRIARKARPQLHSFLDLGCGDGVLGRAVLGEYPHARCVLVDFSETMLAAARQKMGAVENAVFVLEDYGEPGWLRAIASYAPFDLIVSGFSIHHQPDGRKRSLYRELFGVLSAGGLFLNLEHVASATRWGEELFDEYFVEALCRYHSQMGSRKSVEEIAREYYHRPDKAANILAPVEDQCRWLREIGFENVDCYFKIFELALFGGTKPGPGG
jgi:ubiquinone/menaquinone biosynthesis C-methylase UbiE